VKVVGIRADDKVVPAKSSLRHAAVDDVGRAGTRHQDANQASLSTVERFNVTADQ
jgi:hypothetical protein